MRSLSLFALIALVCCLATAQGQSFQIEDPANGNAVLPSITINVPAGTFMPQKPLLIVSTVAGDPDVPFTATLSPDFLPYFAVSPGSGVTTQQVLLLQATSSVLNRTYNGTLTISPSTGGTTQPLSIPLTINVGTGGGSQGALTVNTLQVNLNAQTGQPTPQQSVTVGSSTTQALTFNASPTTTSGGLWLQVQPTSGVTGQANNLLIIANSSGLATGTYQGTVTLTPTTAGVSQNPTTIGVTLTVSGQPTLTFTPTSLSFAHQINATVPGGQKVTFSSTNGTINYTLAANSNSTVPWLLIDRVSGTARPNQSDFLNVYILPSGLTAGQYQGTITVTAPGTSTPTQTIPVNLTVSTNPLLQIGAAPQDFNFQLGGTVPATQNVQIKSSSTALPYTVSVDANAAAWLSVTPAAGTTPGLLTVAVNPVNLSPNKYTGTVTITSPGAGNSPQTFEVVLNVSSSTLLTTQTSALTFNYQMSAGATPPPSQLISIGSTGAPLNYSVQTNAASCNGAWLNVVPTSGSTPATLTVSVNGSVGANIQCTGTIVVSSPGSNNLSIPVTLNTSTAPLLNISKNSISFTVAPGGSQNTQIALTSTDGTPLSFAAGASGTPAGWLFVSPNTGNTPSNLTVNAVAGTLTPGTYNGTITITSANLPAAVNIPVTMTIQSNAAASVDKASLSFTQPQGGTAPPAQTIQVSAANGATPVALIFSAQAAYQQGSGWLSINPSGGTTPGSLSVTANGAGLSQGTYNGSVVIQVQGANNTPVTVPVKLTIGPPQSITLSGTGLTNGTLSFNGEPGGTVPPASLTLTSAGGPINFSIGTTQTTCGGNFFSVAPIAGTTSSGTTSTATITVTPSLTGIQPGTNCTGTFTITAPNAADLTTTVNLAVANVPAPQINSVVNGASFVPGPGAPREIVSIIGTNLGRTTRVLFTPQIGKSSKAPL